MFLRKLLQHLEENEVDIRQCFSPDVSKQETEETEIPGSSNSQEKAAAEEISWFFMVQMSLMCACFELEVHLLPCAVV